MQKLFGGASLWDHNRARERMIASIRAFVCVSFHWVSVCECSTAPNGSIAQEGKMIKAKQEDSSTVKICTICAACSYQHHKSFFFGPRSRRPRGIAKVARGTEMELKDPQFRRSCAIRPRARYRSVESGTRQIWLRSLKSRTSLSVRRVAWMIKQSAGCERTNAKGLKQRKQMGWYVSMVMLVSWTWRDGNGKSPSASPIVGL